MHIRLSGLTVVGLVVVAALHGCTRDPIGCDDGCPAGTKCIEGTCVPVEDPRPYFPPHIDKDIDILFVVDNSTTMADAQQKLITSFPTFFDALKSPRLNNKIPNVHLGVVSTDLGAGSYAIPSCVTGGDDGKLQAVPRVAGCVPPSKPYIEYIDGVVNVNDPSVQDPIEKVRRALSCIAGLGTGGCGFEAQLEAARRALDPKVNRNPGFIRKDAKLAVVFVTDEDDCSARQTKLFDPQQTQLTDPLGPLTSFRCFEFGVQCDCPNGACTRTTVGPRTSCKPAHDWLYSIDGYVSFFKGLKDPGRLFLLAIAGPTDTVAVVMEGQTPKLQPSCQTSTSKGRPAIRIEALIDGIGKTGNRAYFNQGVDAALTQSIPVDICSADHGPALRLLGKVIASSFNPTCVGAPLTSNGGVACFKGDQLGTSPQGAPVTCQTSCLELASCQVALKRPSAGVSTVSRCDASTFRNPKDTDCGATCPCWRLVRDSACVPAISGSPYELEILHKGPANKDEVVQVKCKTSADAWGSAAFAARAQCK